MSTEIKIPTLLGLSILIVGLVAGVLLVNTNQIFKSKASQSEAPKNIQVANLSDTSASIYWQTDQAANGFIKAGISNSLNLTFRDDRDSQSPQPRQLHFVTLTNLAPDTTYYYKIASGADTFPATPLTFKTTSNLPLSSYQPIIGTVVDSSLQPIPEAIVTLELPGAQNLASITKISGSFVLPLASLRTQDQSQSFQIPEAGISAKLVIFDLQRSSRVNLHLPATTLPLPPITLGQDLDLSTPIASPTASVNFFDLNKDGVANALDRSIILKNYGKNPKRTDADLNNDGVVDQKDLQLFDQSIIKTTP